MKGRAAPRSMSLVHFALGALALVACKRSPVATLADAGTTSALTASGKDASAPLPPRCTEEKSFAVDARGVEYGDALVTPAHVFVGIAHDKDGKRRGAILDLARAGDAIAGARLEDAGELAVDAPPPKVVFSAGRARAAMYAPVKGAREIAIDGTRIAQQVDDSFAFDVAMHDDGTGIVAWDEDAPGGVARGVIKVALLPFDPKAPPLVISPDGSDADSPRVALRAGGGYWAAWLAREPTPERDAAPSLEGPGEKKHFTWLETATLDAHGKTERTKRDAAAFRVEAFDIASPPPGDALDVLTKDDSRGVDDPGSRLMRMTLRGDEAKMTVLIAGGLGNGVPDLLPPWAAFTDLQDRQRVVLLEDGRPSTEPLFEGGRPLAALGGAIIAGFPSDSARSVRVLACGKQ